MQDETPVMDSATTICREKEIFLAALERKAPDERRRFVDLACGGDEALKARLCELLALYSEKDSFMCSSGLRRDPEPPALEVSPGTVTGRYRILRKIGAGGGGVVYLAEQISGVRRRVALKVLRAGLDTSSVMARFEAERQALALMDHPNIAKVFDGGATEQGRPFFAMELVEGESITTYCEKKKLSIAERLRLFLLVCDAVQHAHQKAVIHRDIKPSNILVADSPMGPVPKVIDFGIAKALSGRLSDGTYFTTAEQFIGTPAYMSPEQALITSEDIDTRTDIYSLGVLLYEILTGRPPFGNQELLTAGLDEMRRIIRHVEPKRPSECFSVDTDGRFSSKAAKRNARSMLHTDIDWIALKCLEKERDRRYETASALSADIQRHLNDEPVVARPRSRTYQFAKFVRRHKVRFAAGTVAVLALVAAAAITGWQAFQVKRAEQAQARARALAERRLDAALDYVNSISAGQVGFHLQDLIGATEISQALTTNTFRLVAQLRAEEADGPRFRYVLGRLYLQLAMNVSPRGNAAWDPEANYHAATNAIQLLQSVESQTPEDDRDYRLALAEQEAAGAAMHLNRSQEAIDHWNRMTGWARPLTNSTRFREDGIRMERLARYAAGFVLLRKGQAAEALTNCFLPWLAESKAHGFGSSTYVLATGPLAMSHKFAALASDHLGLREEALMHCKEALPHFEEILRRRPNSVVHAHNRVAMIAQLGAAHLAFHQSEGVARLNEALNSTRALRTRDSARFLMTEFQVQKYASEGWAEWAAEPAATLEQRRARIEKAQEHLARAEELMTGFKAESARNALQFDLQWTKQRLANAERAVAQKASATN